jgi:hypothetical protein
MFSQTTTSRALGALFGLTAAITTFLAPAYAATPPAPATITTRDRMDSLDTPMFQPDLRVKYVGRAYNNGKYQYRFRVENIGAASADNIYVDETVHQLTYNGAIGADQSIGGQRITTLASDASTMVTVTCVPLPGYICAGASATAQIADDLDTTNNHAHS